MKFVFMLLSIFAIVLTQTCSPTASTQMFTWDGPTSVPNTPLNQLICVKDTQIDFNLPQTTNANLQVTSLAGGATTYSYFQFVRKKMII
jgi:hypothetical protein